MWHTENEKYSEVVALVDGLVSDFENQMYEQVQHHLNDKDRFTANLRGIWWKSFVAYESMSIIAMELATEHIKANENRNEDTTKYDIKFFALMNIHARAAQIFAEILCLLEQGFTDGAFARWRSLFEISVYALFISRNSNQVALGYINQSDTEEKNATWAKSADCFRDKKGNVTFKMIFDSCQQSKNADDIWYKQYELASKIVHPSPQGTMKRLGNAETNNTMLVTGSDWGLHIPLEHAAITFGQISATFFAERRNDGSSLAIIIMQKWVDVVRKHAYEAVGTCFPNIEDAEQIYKNYLNKHQKISVD